MQHRFRLFHHEELTSTQDTARDLCVKNGAVAGDIITATRQTAGYGRRGRAWQSQPGNLFFTLIEAFDNPAVLSWLGAAMGLALHDTISDEALKSHPIHLKWPNDVLIDFSKCSGMLLEIVDDFVLVGVGVNIVSAPQTDQETIAVNDVVALDLSAQEFLEKLLPHYDGWFQKGRQGGFAALREAWLSRAAYVGETITARLANGRELTGIFKEIDPTGALILATPGQVFTVTAADLYRL